MPQKKLEQEMQNKYIYLQIMKQQLESFAEEKNRIAAQKSELEATVNSINTLSSLKSSQEIWSPLGGGSFVRSDIKDVENVLVSVGAGVVVKKPRADAVKILKSRSDELKTLDLTLSKEMERLAAIAEKTQENLKRLIERHEKTGKKSKNG